MRRFRSKTEFLPSFGQFKQSPVCTTLNMIPQCPVSQSASQTLLVLQTALVADYIHWLKAIDPRVFIVFERKHEGLSLALKPSDTAFFPGFNAMWCSMVTGNRKWLCPSEGEGSGSVWKKCTSRQILDTSSPWFLNYSLSKSIGGEAPRSLLLYLLLLQWALRGRRGIEESRTGGGKYLMASLD